MNTRRWLVAVLIGMSLLTVRSSTGEESQKATEALKRGDSLREKSDFDGAIAAYTEAIQLDPKLAKAYRYRAFAWRKKGEYAKALADYTHALQLNPKDAEIISFCCGKLFGWRRRSQECWNRAAGVA